MEDEKKEVVEGEVVEEKKEEKKEGKFKQFFSKAKQNLDNQMLEGKIMNAFEKANAEFKVYIKEKTLSKTVYGYIKDNQLTYFGEEEVPEYSVVITKDDKAYYALTSTDTTVKSSVDGVEYERPGKCITLDENVEEVNVIKAGDRFFIYKGKEEK